MMAMKQGTKHTATVSAQLSPSEQRENYLAVCKIKLKGKKRWFPQFLPIWNRTIVVGSAHILLERTMKGFPILVELPKTRRTTEFEVFVEIVGREYVVVDTVTAVL